VSTNIKIGGRVKHFVSTCLGRLAAILTEPARLQRFALAGLLATWLPLLAAPFMAWWGFGCFYAAGRLVFSSGLLDMSTIVLLEHNLGLAISPFVYPPALAMLYAPLSALPYALAGLIHLILMGAAYLLALRLGARLLDIPIRRALLAGLVWMPAGVCVATAQNDTLVLLLFVLSLGTSVWSLPGYIGILYKPQLGLPVLGTIWLRRPRYGTLLLLSAGLFHYALGVVATGGDFRWPITWLDTIMTFNSFDQATNGWQTMSISSALAHMLGSQFTIGGYLLSAILLLVSIPVLRRADLPLALSLSLALGIVISPHSYVYDAVLLLPLLGLIWKRSVGHDYVLAGLVSTYAVAAIYVFYFWPVQPLLIATLVWIIYTLRTPRLLVAEAIKTSQIELKPVIEG
jgi:hypothetical protein